MGAETTVTYELSGGVAWLALNRPHKRNAIDATLLSELQAAVRRAQAEARALVIFGQGPCFSAGADLTEQSAREPMEVFHLSRTWHAAFSLLRHGRIPVIAALHGATIGGGLELAAACHIRIADESTFFALPEGTRGIYVGGGASVYVARLLGAARMADMMLTGRVLDAVAAERAGLGWRTRSKGVGDGAAHHSRRAACAAAHPGHERAGRALRREPDGRALLDRSRGSRASRGVRRQAVRQGGAAGRGGEGYRPTALDAQGTNDEA